MKKLLSILYDAKASEAERDDAIIDLGDYDDLSVEDALSEAANNLSLSDMLLSSIGETLANIWIRKKNVNTSILQALPFIAYREVINVIMNLEPSLLENIDHKKKI